MKKLSALILFCLIWAGSAYASLSVVQAQNHESTGVSADTVSITTTSGNLLVALVRQGQNNSSTVTMSDSSGGTNTWTQTTSSYADFAGASRIGIFSSPTTASVTTVTVTWGSPTISTRVSIMVFEISGAATSSVEDSSVNSTVTGNTLLTSGSLTTTNANDILLFGVGASADQASWTNGAGYTIPTNGQGNRLGMQYKIVSSTQSAVTTSITAAASANLAGVFVAFKAAAASSTGSKIIGSSMVLGPSKVL